MKRLFSNESYWGGGLLATLLTLLSLLSCMPEGPTVRDQQENLDALWSVINERYCFLEEKEQLYKMNWDEVHRTYTEKLRAQKYNELAFYDLMSEMLDELRDGHVNLITSFDLSGYRFNPDPTKGLNVYARNKVINEFGLKGRFLRTGGLTYSMLSYEPTKVTFGYLIYSSFSSSLGNIALVMSLMEQMDAVIIDLRGNGGGLVTNVEELLSYFYKERTVVGYMSHKQSPRRGDYSELRPIYVQPAKDTYLPQVPVYILQDKGCYSATNDFLYKVSHAPNVIRVGQKSGGGAGLPASSELPNGWRVRYSAVRCYDRDKRLYEEGIEPDVKLESQSYYDNTGATDKILTYVLRKVCKLPQDGGKDNKSNV